MRDDAERNGVPFEGENKVWEQLVEKPYITKKKSYVVCLDTLGQDREFTDDQRRFILETIKKFISLWEEKERRFLTRDRDLRLQAIEDEKDYIDQGDYAQLNEDEDKQVEDLVQAKDNEGNGFPDDESKNMYGNLQRIIFTSKLFKDKEEWKKGLLNLAKCTVIRLPRLWQSIFYILGYTREQICLEGTNKLFWKYARRFLDE